MQTLIVAWIDRLLRKAMPQFIATKKRTIERDVGCALEQPIRCASMVNESSEPPYNIAGRSQWNLQRKARGCLCGSGAITEGYAVWSATGHLIFYNERFLEFHHALAERPIVGKSFKQISRWIAEQMVHRDVPSVEEWSRWRCEKFLCGSKEFDIQLKEGRWLRIEDRRLLDGRCVSVYRDVTQLKSKELKILEEKSQLRLIIDNIGECIAVLDTKGRIETINNAAEKLFEHSAQDLIGAQFESLFQTSDDNAISGFLLNPLSSASEIRSMGRRSSGCFHVSITMKGVAANGRQHIIATVRDISEQVRAHSKILYKATHDVLTGLPNRALIGDSLEQAIKVARRRNTSVAVFFVDIDHFKTVNDNFGHLVGDEVLVEVARRLRSTVREVDTVARLGGDEFLLIMEDINHQQEILRPARNILLALRQPLNLQGHRIEIRASIGIAFYPHDANNGATLLKHADIAQYRAKKYGRDRFELFEVSMRDVVNERVLLETELRQAFNDGELYLVYQPQYDVQTGSRIGFEALIRWHHPKMGTISPSKFVPIAEKCGLASELSAWVINQVCNDVRAWQIARIDVPRVAINVTPYQLRGGFCDRVSELIIKNGFSPHCLELEMTETTLFGSQQQTTDSIERLCDLGIGFALDDFGRGPSSPRDLNRYPLQRIKIDRKCIRRIISSPVDRALVRAVITIAHTLGIRVLGQGIESQDQFDTLRDMGCDEAQGFFCAQPCQAGDVQAWKPPMAVPA